MAAVTAADIYAPWLSSVPRAQPARAPTEDEIWSSGKTDFQAWWRKTGRLLFNSGLASVAASTRIMYGILDPAHVDDPQHAAHAAFAQELVFGKKIVVPGGWNQPAKDRANHLNMEREAFIEQFRGRWCTAVIDRIEDSTAQLILDPAKPELLTDPDKLFEAIQKRAVGGSAAEVGPRIFREVNAIKWPTKGVNGEACTMVQQADTIVTMYRGVAARFTAIGDSDYTMTEAAMVAAITMKAPAAFDMSVIAKFEACTDLSTLQSEMQKAARRIDERTPTGLNAFVTVDTTADQDSRLDRVEAALVKMSETMATMARRGGGGSGSTSNVSEKRRFDEAAGPPKAGERYCTQHGWQRHSSERCCALHPEIAPAGWVHAGGRK